MSTRKVEMVWRCGACDTENLGRHKVCQTCGDPKDPSEKFELPKGDTRALASVTDPELLKKANAGKDWACERCGANQSATNPKCTQCGATNPQPVLSKRAQKRARKAAAKAAASVAWDPFAAILAVPAGVFLGGGALIAALVGGGVAVRAWMNRPVDVDVTVAEHRWQRAIAVERLALRDFDGFVEDRPADAEAIRSLGDRHHHDEQVLDHYDTEYYTEDVLDGYDTRSYTEEVACGEDCTYEAPTCSESCSSDENGFATCTESCWGGGNSCTTRYCTEYRTEQVPRYRTEQRSRQVPVYRSEPRYAEAFAWKAWRWAPERELAVDGVGLDAQWPAEAAVHLDVGLAPGEDERAAERAAYAVILAGTVDEAPRTWTIDGLSEGAWRAYAPGSAHVLRLDAGGHTILEVDPPDAR